MTRSPKPSDRVASLDIARGVAVTGVVFNHSVDGLASAGLLSGGNGLYDVNQAFYIFRMPLLAFLLGVFIPRGWEKRGTSRYLAERVWSMAWLYLVWFMVQDVFDAVFASSKNSPREFGSFLAFWSPPAHLWFLPYLAVSTAIVVVLRVWQRPRRIPTLTALSAFTVFAWGWNPDIIGLRGISLVAFTAVGAAIGLSRISIWLQASAARWGIAGLVSMTGFVALYTLEPVNATTSSNADLVTRIISVVCAVLGTVMVLALAVWLARVPALSTALAFTGERTIAVYLCHVVIVAGTRVIMLSLGVSEPPLIVSIAVVLGTVIPLAAYQVAPQFRMSWLFHTPKCILARLPEPVMHPT